MKNHSSFRLWNFAVRNRRNGEPYDDGMHHDCSLVNHFYVCSPSRGIFEVCLIV